MSIEATFSGPGKGRGGFLRKKVAGIPVLYLALAAAIVLAVIAYRLNAAPSSNSAADPNVDPSADPSGDGVLFPEPTTGTVIVAPTNPIPTPTDSIDTNDEWLKKSVLFLINERGANPGIAQVALQTYLEGNSLTVEQGKLRDAAVRQFGLPPETFTAGDTALPRPSVIPRTGLSPLLNNVTMPIDAQPVATPTVAPKPAPPKVRTHVVRPGDTLTRIGARYKVPWRTIYNANRRVIGSNPNLIKPGQRLVIPWS